MKIKLALLDSDQNYLNRIVTAFNIKYADKLEIYSFTKLESAMAALEPSRIDVLVASDTFVVESSALPKRCQLAYFVESADVDSVNDQRAICKFQKADLIYRQILSIYSEYAGSASGLKLGDDSCKVIAFTSPCGGVGSSTMAAACARVRELPGLKYSCPFFSEPVMTPSAYRASCPSTRPSPSSWVTISEQPSPQSSLPSARIGPPNRPAPPMCSSTSSAYAFSSPSFRFTKS